MSTLSELLETLRHRAEEYTADAATTRRPSWAPALVISDEFVQLARTVGLLKNGDKPVIRLWGKFADPRTKGTLLREQVGLTLAGVRCRGFDVYVGIARKGSRLYQAKRGDQGEWEHGPHSWEVPWNDDNYRSSRSLGHELSNQQTNCRWYVRTIDECGGPEQQPNMVRDLERVQQVCANLEQKYRAARTGIDTRNAAQARLLVLARERVIEFGGGDHLTQMVAGARVTGHCCICGKELTDPVSIERGIGPDCYSKHSIAINAWVARQQNKAA